MRIRSGRLRDEMHENAIELTRGFFIALQAGRDWLSLGATKTRMAHRLRDGKREN